MADILRFGVKNRNRLHLARFVEHWQLHIGQNGVIWDRTHDKSFIAARLSEHAI